MVPKKIMDKLLALKKEDKFFSTALKANELDWNGIMECLEIFKYDHPSFKGKFPNSIEFVSTLSHLEKLGLDYNSLDTYGNKFLDYVFEIKKSQGTSKIRTVSEESLDYIVKKTDNIYYLNALNQNILFNFVEGYSGFTGKEFLKYAKEYNFDLNQIDIYGKTVFHYAIEKKVTLVLLNTLLIK
jgi:hypothetical protein